MGQFAFLQREWAAVFEAVAKPRQEVVMRQEVVIPTVFW
jgi:hypothetical protein